ncbi:unnamed protein product [Rotaria magnacalcarata]|uniref:Uncharacterized protein n=2 Tax=Rotaria magnacalcarata TaxID=392030 RepID=A0A820NMI0_9BILA|nr:unnamed protein product [Rotaria magnacalcarata]
MCLFIVIMSFHSQRDAETAAQTEALKLIDNVVQDLRNTSKIGNERKQELITTCTKAGERLIQIQIQFRKSTKEMVDNLLQDSEIDCSISCTEENINKRKHYYERYRRSLDSAMIRSEALARSVYSILMVLVEKDPKLTVKYKIFLTASIIVPVFGVGVIVGIAVAHMLPVATCPFTLCALGIGGLAVGGGIILSITTWLVYKTIQTGRFDWKKRMGELSDRFRDVLRKFFPFLESFFFQGHKEKVTGDELQKALSESLVCMKVDESTWLHDDSLRDFQNLLQETITELDEDHSIVEQRWSTAA